MDRFRLDGQRALVTGGSRGIGLAIAKGYAEAGADVVIVARKVDELEAAAETLRSTGRAIGIEPFDLAGSEAIPDWYPQVLERHGPIDILVNGAAISRRGPSSELAIGDFDTVQRVNLTGVFALSQAFVRARLAIGRPGRIVNIASIASMVAVRTPSVAYVAAKGGMVMLTKQMAAELAPQGILVNAIAPGYMRTEMTAGFRTDAAFEAWREERVPLRRWGEPDEIVGAAILLASPAGSFITGSVLTVDGGLTAVI
jgi:gluconate 5-dehydrogenase